MLRKHSSAEKARRVLTFLMISGYLVTRCIGFSIKLERGIPLHRGSIANLWNKRLFYMYLRNLQNPVGDINIDDILRTPHPLHGLIYLDDNWGAWSWKGRTSYPGPGWRYFPDGEWETWRCDSATRVNPCSPDSFHGTHSCLLTEVRLENISSGYLQKLHNIPRNKENKSSEGQNKNFPYVPEMLEELNIIDCFERSLLTPGGGSDKAGHETQDSLWGPAGCLHPGYPASFFPQLLPILSTHLEC